MVVRSGQPARSPGASSSAVQVAEPTRVMLVGDQPLYRAGLRSLIERRGDFRIVAESASELASVERALETRVDLVVIDFDLILGSDLAGLEALLKQVAARPILILSSGLEPEPCHVALRGGISGIILKASGGDVLLRAMDSARRGQVWLERSVLARMFAESSQVRKVPASELIKIAQLTAREKEIVQVACTGLTNKQIGEKLSISEATVRHHLMSVFSKLEVSTRSELVVYGYRYNLCTKDAS